MVLILQLVLARLHLIAIHLRVWLECLQVTTVLSFILSAISWFGLAILATLAEVLLACVAVVDEVHEVVRVQIVQYLIEAILPIVFLLPLSLALGLARLTFVGCRLVQSVQVFLATIFLHELLVLLRIFLDAFTLINSFRLTTLHLLLLTRLLSTLT